MSDAKNYGETFERYLKARIPFISVRTAERARVLAIIREVAHAMNLPVFVHTLSQGMGDIVPAEQ